MGAYLVRDVDLTNCKRAKRGKTVAAPLAAILLDMPHSDGLTSFDQDPWPSRCCQAGSK
jgi:hypothetical protein